MMAPRLAYLNDGSQAGDVIAEDLLLATPRCLFLLSLLTLELDHVLLGLVHHVHVQHLAAQRLACTIKDDI
jgi:hypothetical protein